MAYNYNPNFAKHINAKSNTYKNIKRTGDETAYSNPSMFDMRRSNYNESKKPKVNFIDSDNFEESVKMYKLEDLDNPNGWNFSELDMLGEMNFRIDDEYKMYSEVDIPSLQLENDKMKTYIYKTDEGYVIETNRKYVFETFAKLLEYIDSIPMKRY